MGNDAAIKKIQDYLDKRAKEDKMFAEMYDKAGKSIEECFSYIVGVAKERGNAVCMTDEEVYGLAVHYYCEDGLRVKGLPMGFKVKTSGSDDHEEAEVLTDEEKARIKAEAEEEYKERCVMQLDQEAVLKIRHEAVEEYKKKYLAMQKSQHPKVKGKKVEEALVGMGNLFGL